MMPQHVAFVAFMLLERQRVAAFVLHLLLFASREGSVPSGKAFLGRFLPTLPPTQASSLLARHSSEDSCYKRAFKSSVSFVSRSWASASLVPFTPI